MKSVSAQLLIGLDGQPGSPFFTGRGPTRDCEIIRKPPRIARLPIQAHDPAEVRAEGVLPDEHVEQEARGDWILEPKAPAAGYLDGRPPFRTACWSLTLRLNRHDEIYTGTTKYFNYKGILVNID